MEERELAARIKSGRPAGLYFFYGSEDFTKNRRAAELCRAAAGDDPSFAAFNAVDLFFGEDLIGGRLRSPRAATLPELTAQAVRIFSETTDLRADIQAQMLLLETAEALQVPLEVRSPAAGGRNFVETLDLMNRRCTAELTVNELADYEGMSRGAFSREFARNFGIPPKQYLERMLMRRAETLLRQPGMNVRTTAERLRFSSEFYFSRFFRRHAGVSPDEFRRRVL